MIDKIKDALSGPIEFNTFNVILFIIAAVLAIALIIGLNLLAFRSFAACCKYTKKNRYPFFHIGHIISYGIIVGYYFLQKDYLDASITEKIPLPLIIAVGLVLFTIPTVMNFIKCKAIYGLQYTIWQMVFSLIFCSVVCAIVGIIILILAVAIGAAAGAPDENRIWLVNYNTSSFPVRMVSSVQAIDNNGNYYYRNGNYFYDDENNCYWQTST